MYARRANVFSLLDGIISSWCNRHSLFTHTESNICTSKRIVLEHVRDLQQQKRTRIALVKAPCCGIPTQKARILLFFFAIAHITSCYSRTCFSVDIRTMKEMFKKKLFLQTHTNQLFHTQHAGWEVINFQIQIFNAYIKYLVISILLY